MFRLFQSSEEKKLDTYTVPKEMTLEEVRLAMLKLMAEENTNHYRMGQLYNHVVDSNLAIDAGYKNAQAYFRQHLVDLSQSALTMYGAVAREFSEPLSRRFGITCLYLLLTYAEAAEVEVNYAEPGGMLIDVPDGKGGVTSKPFSRCSVDEMRRAIQRRRKPASSKPLPEADRVLAERYMSAVTGQLPKGTALRVQVRNHKGKTVLDFRGIPLTQVKQLILALQAQLPAEPEVKQEEVKAPQDE